MSQTVRCQRHKDAFNAMLPWLQEEYGNASQPYSFARKPKKALMEARTLIAECIGAQPDEIYFTSGGTESDNWAIKGIAEKGKKHHTIATQIEHHAILNACRRLEHFGFQVDYLPVDKQGVVSCEDLVKFIKGNTELISVMMVNNEIGTIEPIKELATVAHDNGILFHTDAVQAVGHIPIDVSDLCVDMLSASAHKFNGPKDKAVIRRMAAYIGVSYTALVIRLRDMGLFEYHNILEYISNELNLGGVSQ